MHLTPLDYAAFVLFTLAVIGSTIDKSKRVEC
jgi:hypothetical protein